MEIELQRIRAHQIETLRKWRNESEIYSYCRQTDLISEYDQERWFQKINSDPTIEMYLITDSLRKDMEKRSWCLRINQHRLCPQTSRDQFLHSPKKTEEGCSYSSA